MKSESAIGLYNELCTTAVGGSEEHGPIDATTKFGIFMLTQDGQLYLPYKCRIRKEMETNEEQSEQYQKNARDSNEKTREENTKEKARYIIVANAIRAWADAIEETAHANT